ncbi:mechanosensitive ion channel domain-containing protein [Vibrio owensii]|uniref:mechanosensitive ion channel domain-containing protein n=2 Tax=Vibrio owensii TaxID=696485 RepID=UPI003AAADFAD
MAIEPIAIDEVITGGLTQAETWFSSNSSLLIQYGVNIISAVFILFIGNIIAKSIAGSVGKVLQKKQMDKAVIEFIHGIVRYSLFVVVLIAALGRIGVQTASVVAVIGAAGLAVGLALQGSLSNFAAGVLIVAFRPFKSGDYVEVGGVAGCVDAIQIFQTVLVTIDNKIVIVPNSSVIGSPITNYSKLPTRRVDLTISVSYKADLKHVKQVIREALEKDTRILDNPGIDVGVLELDDSGVKFVVRPWCKTEDYWNVYFDSTQAVKEALDTAGIEIPYPQMDVHIRNKVI